MESWAHSSSSLLLGALSPKEAKPALQRHQKAGVRLPSQSRADSATGPADEGIRFFLLVLELQWLGTRESLWSPSE